MNNSRGARLCLKEWQKVELSKVDSERGVQCLLDIWGNSSYKDLVKGSFCDGIWDGVYCWPPSKPVTKLIKTCSHVLQSEYPEYASKISGNVTRVCLANGSWFPDGHLVYTECIKSVELHISQTEEDEKIAAIVSYMLFYGSLLSLFCLSACLKIFLHYRCLRCDRMTIQTQLILSLLLRCALMFIMAEQFVLGHPSSYRDVDILCETVLVIFLYATFATVTWMFLQGLYLNITLMCPVANANGETNLRKYHIIGWALPAVFVMIYVIVMALKKPERCWSGFSQMKEIWIILGPIILELIANVFFLCNVLRIIIKKIRRSSSRPDASQIKATAKAFAILFPVLGINNLIFFYYPNGEFYNLFVMLNTFFGSTQGVFVAIVYCFANKDVVAAIRRSIQRANARRMNAHNQVQNNPPEAEVIQLAVLNLPNPNY